jgi:hypothetical protein
VSHEDFELNEIETTDPTPPGVVHLDGVALYLAGGPPQNQSVQFSDLARFQPKILFGDPSKDDNDLLSVWQQSDFSGGNGVFDMKEGTDNQRFHFATLYGRFPNALTKPYRTRHDADVLAAPEDGVYVLGEFWSSKYSDFVTVIVGREDIDDLGTPAVLLYVFDKTVADGFEQVGGAGVDTPTDGLDFVPTNPGVAFQGLGTRERLFVPCGNNGYAYIDDTNAVGNSTAQNFNAFTVWDNKLIGITTGGRIYRCTDADGSPPTWTAYDTTWALSKSYRIRGMVNYFDRRDEPCIYIITDRDLWQFEPDGPELFRIDNGWPGHPWHGKAHAVFNGQLFIAVGMSVKRYTGGTWMDVGLDRDDGLLAPYANGYIKAMTAGSNALYALVQAPGTNDDDPTYGGRSALFEFNGSGWQCIWTQDRAVETLPSGSNWTGTDLSVADEAATITDTILVTGSNSQQHLVWGASGENFGDNGFHFMNLPLGPANPRQAIRAGQHYSDQRFSFFMSGRFDADMKHYTKIANQLDYELEEPIEQTTVTKRDTIKWWYAVDGGDWELITSHRADPGQYHVPLGEVIEGTTFREGLPFEYIQLRCDLIRPAVTYDTDKPTVISNIVLSFLKTVSSNFAFTVAVDIKNGSADGLMSPEELADWIDALPQRKKWIRFTVGDDDYKVFVSQNLGTRWTGDIQSGNRQISIIQIPGDL